MHIGIDLGGTKAGIRPVASKTVVLAVALGGVAYQVVRNMLHVGPDLVLAPCFGADFHQ